MTKKIDPREMFIVWIVFLLLHSELYAEHILKRFKGATNDDMTMTMKGTLLSSLLLIIVLAICSIVF
jgi:hypothetical protein